jgi:lysophospholipase L1-like esterase
MGVQFVAAGAQGLTCSTAPVDTGGATIAPGAKIFYLGDSLTYGMVKLGGLLDKTQAAGFTADLAPAINGSSTPFQTYTVGGAYGNSVSATGGITIGDTTRLAVDYSETAIAQAGAIIIGLGTNAKAEAKAEIDAAKSVPTSQVSDADVATAQAAQIPLLISKLKAINSTAPIFWVNVHTSNAAYANYVTVNQTIASGQSAGYTVIDLAGAIDAGTTPAPDGGDDVHYGPSGYGTRAQWLVDQLKALSSANSSVFAGGYDPLSLTYPAFPDDAAIASSIESYIREKTPSSPWLTIPNIGEWIVSESKSRGINPMIVVGLGKQENNFGTVGSNAKDNNNYFGVKGDNGYVHYDTPLLGMTGFLNALKRNIVDRTHPSYKNVSSFYEYVSVHQTGGIHYPGDGMNIYDSAMDVYVSWDTQYNPRNYWTTVTGVVSAITGLTISPEIPARGSSSAVSQCASETPENSTAGGAGSSEFIRDCTANGGNAAIACTAINQLQGIPYNVDARAAPTDPDPKFLDCSALVTMAIYRTFGVDLKGMCSVQFLSDPNFTTISLHDIQPGDMVGWGTECGPDAHISIVASYDAATDDIVIMQASSPKTPSGPKSGKLGGMEFTWAVRYVGQKTLQPGAL